MDIDSSPDRQLALETFRRLCDSTDDEIQLSAASQLLCTTQEYDVDVPHDLVDEIATKVAERLEKSLTKIVVKS